MLKRFLPLIFFSVSVVLSSIIIGCSKDDDPVTPPDNGGSFIIRLRDGQVFKYDRWQLTEANAKDEATKSTYTTSNKKSNGVLTLGGYTDWFCRFGVDSKAPLEQDTLYLRVDQSNGDIFVYGFQREIYDELVQAFATIIPGGVGAPTLPSAQWDKIASYTGTAGTTTWNISDISGQTLVFSTPIGPISVSVTISGKYEAKDEKITVGTTTVTARKTSIDTKVNVLNNTFTIKIYMWFSDNPAGQIKIMQESAKFTLLTWTLPIPGEIQELSAIPN